MSDTPDDAQKYAALEAEMSQPAADLQGFEAGQPHVPDAPPPEQYRHEPQHYQQQPEPQQSQQQQYQQPAATLPDIDDDPIGHFEARSARAEGVIGQMHDQMQNERVWNYVRADEDRARNEVGTEEYDAACEHAKNSRRAELYQQLPLNSQHVRAWADYYRADPRQVQQALVEQCLQRDINQLTAHAIQNGRAPADAYWEAAMLRGYKPKVTVGKTMEKRVSDWLKHGNDKQADDAWRWYSHAKKIEDENWRD